MEILITADNVYVDNDPQNVDFFPTEDQRYAVGKIMNHLEDTEGEAFYASKERDARVAFSIRDRHGKLTQYSHTGLLGAIQESARIIGRFLYEHEEQAQFVNAG